jgi:hypothetical protein
VNADRTDTWTKRAIVALRDLLAQLEGGDEHLQPWRGARPPSGLPARMSATDQLSWWFRPAVAGDDPWDGYFAGDGSDLGGDLGGLDDLDGLWGEPAAAGLAAVRAGATPRPAPALPAAEPPSRRTALRMLLAEPEEELVDGDAESVVTCLYDFVHAVGRRDVEAAMACVAADYSTIEDDREVDADGLAARLRALLDPLHGWDLDAFLVEIPQPVLHPAGILVPVEIQLDAREPGTGARRTVVHRRIAVFDRQPDQSWRIVALSAV